MMSFFVTLLKLCIELVRGGFIRKPSAIERTVVAYAKIYPILNTMLCDTGAKRVLLLKAMNGGGIPKPGCTLRSSVLAEVFRPDKDSEPIASSWQEQRVDGDYVQMLSRVLLNQSTNLITAELNDGSILSELYKSSDVVYSRVVLIATLPEMMIYLSINFTDGEPASLTHEEHEAIRAGTNQLQQIFGGDR